KEGALTALAWKLRRACSDEVVKQVQAAGPEMPEKQDELLRILHPLDKVLEKVEDPNPAVRFQKARAEALWAWNRDRYHYESEEAKALADGGRSAAQKFYEDAEGDYKDVVGGRRPAAVACRLTLKDGSLDFQQGDPQARVVVGVQASGKGVRLGAIAGDDDWLKVPEDQDVPPEGDVPLTIRMPPGAEQSKTAPPAGMLVRAVVDGRSFHRKIGARMPEQESKRLVVYVSDSPKESEYGRLRKLELRP